MKNNIITLFLLYLAFSGFSQDSLTYDLSYDVHVNYAPISISEEQLKEAVTLIDLNDRYKSSWMKEYISVEILTSYKGTVRKALSKNDTLSQQQKDHMISADLGTDISVKATYVPIGLNDVKEYKFTFTIHPENGAEYVAGQEELKKYLKATAIDNIAEGSLKQYQLAAIKFTISEEGQVVNPHIFWRSEDEKTDTLLLETIRQMPDWKPATYANGIKTKQELVFTVGDMESCAVNLLNIRDSPIE